MASLSGPLGTRDAELLNGALNHPRFKLHHDLYPTVRAFKVPFFITLCVLLFWSTAPLLLSFNPEKFRAPLEPRHPSPQDAGLSPTSSTTSSSTSTSTAVVNVFQVSTPVTQPQGRISDDFTDTSLNTTSTTSSDGCRVTLMDFTFANSGGKPFGGDYKPPTCIDNANTVIMNFTVTSKGVQFDRLALMYLGDTEVFRTSTAEPKRSGIRWVYEKDMSHYMSMWKAPQKLIFDLANFVDSNFTGVYNTTLTATFFNANDPIDAADLIIPISTRQGLNTSSPSVFAIPIVNASNTITFPRNANRAVFSISSCGQGTEEFWWSNSPTSDIATFQGGTISGFSPFREVQLFIDGMLAGVQWPFPIIFTGGVVPGLWSPVVGIDAFDLQENEIDISPWLGMLCDGSEHTFSMNVAGLKDNGRDSASIVAPVNSSWSVTGKIFVWLDDTNSITTGTTPKIMSNDPTISISQSQTQNSTGGNAQNQTLSYSVSVSRTIAISSTITSESGDHDCSWTQVISHMDDVNWSAFGNTEVNRVTTSGTDSSTGPIAFSRTYSYPLYANTTAFSTPDGNISLSATIMRSKIITTTKSSIYPSGLQAFSTMSQTSDIIPGLSGTTLTTTQNGSAVQFRSPKTNISFGFGNTAQEMRFGGVSGSGAMGMEPDTELYFRSVATVNGTLTKDSERVGGERTADFEGHAPASDATVMSIVNTQEAFVRSPGLQKFGVVENSALVGTGNP